MQVAPVTHTHTNAGMSVAQALFVVGIGNSVTLLPMILNAHPGTKYGVCVSAWRSEPLV